MLGQIFLAKSLSAQVPFDGHRAVQPAEHAEDDKVDELKEVPCAVVLDLEHDQLPRAERVDEGQGADSDQSAQVAAPERFQREVGGDFLQIHI